MPWKDKEKVRDYHRRHYAENRERLLNQTKQYNASHPEKVKNAHKRRYSNPEHRARILNANKEWRKANPKKSCELTKRYNARHPELVKERQKKWRMSESGRAWRKVWDAKHRAEKLDVTVNPKSINIYVARVRASHSIKCYYCESFVSGKKAHIDHIIPLSKGGPHSIENLCATCSHCNLTKSAKLITDFITLGQQLFSI